MANYCCALRTNYFRVKDPEKFRKFMQSVVTTEDTIDVWEDANSRTGETEFGFGCYGSICGLPVYENSENNSEDEVYWEDCDYDAFVNGLSELVAEDDAIIILESGNEKLRYVVGQAQVITSRGVDFIDIGTAAAESAAKLLNDPSWKTRVSY